MLVNYKILKYSVILAFIFVISVKINAQNQTKFWDKVRYGGSAGLNFGTGFFSASLSPSAIYQFNDFVALGTGISYSYINVKNISLPYTTHLYGASVIGLVNPIENIQLSAELEQTLVQTILKRPVTSDDYWVTALFLGVGYRSGGATIGVRYNILFDENKTIYNSALLPFIRIYF